MFTRGLFGLISLIILVYTVLLFPKIESDLILLFRVILYGAILIAVVSVVLAGMVAREKFLTIQAQRKKAQLESSLVVSNGETWVQEHIFKTNGNGKREESIEYARLGGIRHRVNSHDHNPTASEILYAHTMLSTGQSKQLLPGEYNANELVIEQKQDLLELIDSYPHTHIYGTTGGGKTSLLRTIAYRRQSQGHQVLVLDSTEHPSKWQELDRVRDRNKQNECIEKLFSIYKQNENALSSGQATEKDFKQITVLSDEWTDIVFENELAKSFIREQIRKVRKFGLHLVFATQTDLASDLGLDGAYKTTTSFLKVECKKISGKHIAIARVGHTILGEFDLPLPPPLPELLPTGYIAPTLETVKVIEPTLTQDEEKIIKLVESGASYKEVSEAVWGIGKYGKFYNEKIDKVLDRS